MRRSDRYRGSGCLWVCRDNRLAWCCGDHRLAGRASTSANVEPNDINLNQHDDDDDPYDSQFDSLRTLSEFLH